MVNPATLGALSTRKNILKLLLGIVLLQMTFTYLLPTSVNTSLNDETFEEKVDLSGAIGHLDEDFSIPAEDEPIVPFTPPLGQGISNPDSSSTAVKSSNEEAATSTVVAAVGSASNNKPSAAPSLPKTDPKTYFKTAVDIFLKNKPQGIEDIQLNDKAPSYYYIDIPNPTFTIEFLTNFTKMSEEQFDELKKRHDQLKLDILDFAYPDNTFSGKGIVMIGGGSFLGTALTSIRSLRETGSKLPLQLMLTDKSEYDEDVCEKLLPKLNAKCMIMEEIIGEETFATLKLQKYELKVLGLFLSTFEEVLLLDADNLAVKDPDYILDSKPYKQFGYVIWPDFWRQTISPYFYKIAGVEIGEPIRKDGVDPQKPNPPRAQSQLSDLEGAIPDSTCEAGQLAINKKHHHKALLATVYYNLFGFKYYYFLLGQGAVGIGDKDTFIAGLTVFKEQYYFVKQRPLLYGYDHAGGWQDTTMVQYDPEQDYEYYEAAKKYLIEKGLDSRVNLHLNFEYTGKLRDEIHQAIQKPKPEVQFLHIHSPKFNAKKNLENNDYETDGHERRQFGSREKIRDQLPLDWELKISRISQWLACDSEIIPKDWKDLPREEICGRIKKHVDYLIETSDSPEMAQLRDIGV